MWSVDKNGKPMPWFTYPAIEYLNEMDLSNKTIFEYGSGYSTIYWSKRAKLVTSVENNLDWYNLIKKKLRKTNYILESDKEGYVNSIKKGGKKYDLIIIDGDYRDSCAKIAVEYLSEKGFIILDNSDWFQKSCKLFRDKDLIEINFSGFAPSNHYTSTTSMFLKRGFDYVRSNHKKLNHVGRIYPFVKHD